MSVMGGKQGNARSKELRRRIAAAQDLSIVVLAAIALILVLASALAPRLQARMEPSRISLDEGNAFTFGPDFQPRWPFVVPSHPDFPLAPGDVQVTENGELLGTLEPSHDTIRRLGQGRFNLWQGGLWFSTSDNTDPRTNGRSYAVRVKTRLSWFAGVARNWSVGVLLLLTLCRVLVLSRVGPLVLSQTARATSRLSGRLALSARSRAGLNSIVRRAETWSGAIGRLARYVPLTLARTFALVGAVLLLGFCWQSLAGSMPLLFQIDSYGYVRPGLVWATGGDMAGQSSRDLGYPALTLLAARLGSLATLPRLQLLMVSAGLACVLGVLYLVLASAASRLHERAKIPNWMLALLAGAGAALYLVLLSSHDLFVVNIYSAMAEAPHFLPTALALLLFVAGWTARTSGRRVELLALATVAAYLSVMVKPHTSIVVGLCAASLIVVGLRHAGVFRSPRVFAICAALASLVLVVHRLDAWVTPRGADFGPKTLFCNHLDVIEPVFDTSTPERARVMGLLRGALQNTDGWPVMGYDGDKCVYNGAFTNAIVAAAKSESREVGAWEQREFLHAVVHNPVAYGHDVAKQLFYFLVHPIDDVNYSAKGSITEDGWRSLEPFSGLIGLSRDQLEREVTNWVPKAYPALASDAKRLLQRISASFAAVALGSTVAALAVIVFFRDKTNLRPEITLVATASFTAAFAMTTALAHTFDVGRYLTDILPFSLLWWLMGVAYLAHGLVLAGALAFRRSRPPLLSSQVRATERH